MNDLPYHVDPRSVADEGSELSIQVALRRALKTLAPKAKLVAVPNGGQRSAWAAMQAKKEGMSAGFPDVLVMAPGGYIAFLEIKAKAGSLSEAQLDWLCHLHNMGFPVGVFRSVGTALDFLRKAGFPVLKERVAA